MGRRGKGKSLSVPEGQRPITQFFRKLSANGQEQINPNQDSAPAPSSEQPAHAVNPSSSTSSPGCSTSTGVNRGRNSGKYEIIGDEVQCLIGPVPKKRNVLDIISLCSDSETSPPVHLSSSGEKAEVLHQNNESAKPGQGSSTSSNIGTLSKLVEPQPTNSTEKTNPKSAPSKKHKKKQSVQDDQDFEYCYSEGTSESDDGSDFSQHSFGKNKKRRLKRQGKPGKKTSDKRKKVDLDGDDEIEVIEIVQPQGSDKSTKKTSDFVENPPITIENQSSINPTNCNKEAKGILNPGEIMDMTPCIDECGEPAGSQIESNVPIDINDIRTPPLLPLNSEIKTQPIPNSSRFFKRNETLSSSQESEPIPTIQLSPACSPVIVRKEKISPPKPKANYYSPVRHIQGAKKNSPNLKSSPTPTTSRRNNDGSNSHGESVRKSLNFNSFSSNSSIKSGGSGPQSISSSQNSGTSSIQTPPETKANPVPPTPLGDQKIFEPYYMETFQQVLDTVPNDYAHLFDDQDTLLLQRFHSLSKQSKLLYIRLFNRKWEWKQACDIKYDNIAQDLVPFFQELHTNTFLLEIRDSNIGIADLDLVLDALKAEQATELGKQLNLTKATTKEGNKSAVFKMIKSQRMLHGDSLQVVLKRIFKIIGPTYRVSEESKNLFNRMFLLYSPPNYWDDETDQSSNLSLLHLLVKIGKMKYPAYSINKVTHIYRTRDDIIRFSEAWKIYSEVQSHIEAQSWEALIKTSDSVLYNLKSTIFENNEIITFDKSLPSFLRAYTAGSLYVKILSLTVEAFQKTNQHKLANEMLKYLLDQDVYFPNYRGRWHERIIINSKHEKMTDSDVLMTIGNALKDPFVGNAERLDFTERYQRLKESISKKKKPKRKKKKQAGSDTDNGEFENELEQLEDNNDIHEDVKLILKETITEKHIEGEQMQVERTYGKSVFMGSGNTATGNTLHNVESFAIHHYTSRENFTHGVHGEGSVLVTIYGLIFWSVIYDDSIGDSFHTQFQPFPLDLLSPDFYSRRENMINEILQNLRDHWSFEYVFDLIEENWNTNFETISIVNWSVFSGVDEIKGLVKSMGLKLVASICERLAQNYRYYRSGFPDLTVWNTRSQECKFVEVKGPGDQLSKKQKLWLEYLSSNGAKVEVCRVKSVSNKRIQRKK